MDISTAPGLKSFRPKGEMTLVFFVFLYILIHLPRSKFHFMKSNQLKNYSNLYKTELLENVIPFWQQHSKDETNGGYYTCLLRNGEVFDTDKFIWLQARQVWMFAKLYEQIPAQEDWLKFAKHGAEFLLKHGRDENKNWYFSLRTDGKPLVQAYNIFSDCFAAMAFGQLAKVTQNEAFETIAVETFQNILKRKDNPKGQYNKVVDGTRPMKNFALPMILCNLSLELQDLLDKTLVEQTIRDCIHEVMDVFYSQELDLILENVSPVGNFVDSFDGRLINPGHAIEAMWFMMNLGERLNDKALIELASSRALRMLEYGWDKEFGGIFYFLDAKGFPPQQLEWDQKLWWVHLETLICLLKGFHHTQNQDCWNWFEKVHSYTWEHFRDPEFGEWFGYLNRRGDVLLPLKGGKWKGCFHVPRGLWQCWSVLEKLA